MMEFTKATLQICKYAIKRVWYKITNMPESLLLIEMIVDNNISYDDYRKIVKDGVNGEENQKMFLDLIQFFEDAEKRGEVLTKAEKRRVMRKYKTKLKEAMKKK